MAMDEAEVRARAEAFCQALAAGNVDAAIEDLSGELRRNLGEVLGLLPLPVTEGNVASIERGSSAFVVVVRLVGETDEVELETRWKERDGSPRIVELSHRSRTALEPPIVAADEPDTESA